MEDIFFALNEKKIYKNVTFTPKNTVFIVKYLSNYSRVDEPVVFQLQSSFTNLKEIKKEVYNKIFLSAIEPENLEILKDELFSEELSCPGYIKRLINSHLEPPVVEYGEWWFEGASCEYSFTIEYQDGIIFIPLYTSCILEDSLKVWVEVCIV